jgi:alpha-N-arabinofuranosidase
MNPWSRLTLLTLLLVPPASQSAGTAGTITLDATQRGARIPSSLYGIFFEEISHAGEGGLYAELIQNRGFEDSRLPPACSLEGGFVIPPRTPHFLSGRVSDWRMRWEVTSDTPAWTLETTGGSGGSAQLVDEQPLTPATPHSLRVTVTAAPPGGRVALVNDGFWGISVVDGASYKLSFYARAEDGFRGPVTAILETASGRALATGAIQAQPGLSSSWRKYEATLTSSGTDPKARFVLTFGSTGRVWIDFVSLFPARTWRDRPNGLRTDLATMIAGLKPAFVRWPGGCFVEGIAFDTRPQWKRSIGPVEERAGTYSPWGYWSSDGLGYHEFLQFSEDLGADALYVANAGVSCAFRSGTFLPDDQLDTLIQDTLDAIEYATGPTTSTWGTVRAKNGHPAPFPLKYVEVGNEQQGARYGARVGRFYQAIKREFPQIKVVLSSWIAGIDRPAIDAAGRIDIVDEHAYKPLHWAIENFDSFAKYKREGWELYIGEFATNGGVGRGNLAAALNDAVYMMSMEKNADLVKMGSYAPLLENVNKRDWEVNLIHFDSSRAFGRAAYYAVKLFAEHRPDVNLATTVRYEPTGPRPIAGRIGVGTFNTAAEFKDIVVEKDGKTVYRSDFSTDAAGWKADGRRGTWAVESGAYRQRDPAVSWSYFGEPGWDNFTLSLKARKISGAEGFLVAVGSADGRRVQWNVGGWGNRRHAVQVADAVAGEFVQGGVEDGRWYDVRVEIRDRTVRCFLDGQLIQERTLPRIDTVLAVGGRDEAAGEIVLKVVNSAAKPAPMSVVLKGVERPSTEARVTVLSSAHAEDENSFEEPTKIIPKTTTVRVPGPTFSHVFPPHSLTILRIKAGS